MHFFSIVDIKVKKIFFQCILNYIANWSSKMYLLRLVATMFNLFVIVFSFDSNTNDFCILMLLKSWISLAVNVLFF